MPQIQFDEPDVDDAEIEALHAHLVGNAMRSKDPDDFVKVRTHEPVPARQ